MHPSLSLIFAAVKRASILTTSGLLSLCSLVAAYMILAYSAAVHEGRIEPLIGMPLRPRVCRFQSSHGKGQTVSRLLRTKSIDNMVDESQHGANRLRRTLGPWSLAAFGIVAVIGSGIFIITGTAAAGESFHFESVMHAP